MTTTQKDGGGENAPSNAPGAKEAVSTADSAARVASSPVGDDTFDAESSLSDVSSDPAEEDKQEEEEETGDVFEVDRIIDAKFFKVRALLPSRFTDTL
jgi:hypothetical protein